MKLIQTTDYLLLIDIEAEIKEGDYIECIGDVIQPFSGVNEYYKRLSEDKPTIKWNKIIAYHPLTTEAKELDLPELPPFEGVDIEKLSEEYARKQCEDKYHSIGLTGAEWGWETALDFKAGYKAAQSKQFSLEDMKKAIEMARQLSEHGIVDEEYDIENLLGYTEADTTRIKVKYSKEEIIQSLSTQQLPKEFIPEYEKEIVQIVDNKSLTKTFFKGVDYENLSKDVGVKLRDKRGGLWDFPTYNRFKVVKPKRLKTTTNSEGKQEICGTYKY